MGNCLKSPTSDDISLLHESQSDRASYGDGAEPDQEPPPPYQHFTCKVYLPVGSWSFLSMCLLYEQFLEIKSFCREQPRTAPRSNTALNSLSCSHCNYSPKIAKQEWEFIPIFEQVPVPVYHPTPSQTRLATQLTEEEQIRIAQRIGLIQHLPKGVYDPGRDGSEKKIRECVICMMDFVYGDPIRFLPCMHIYHLDCIDDWLMRSFTCPSCMEPMEFIALGVGFFFFFFFGKTMSTLSIHFFILLKLANEQFEKNSVVMVRCLTNYLHFKDIKTIQHSTAVPIWSLLQLSEGKELALTHLHLFTQSPSYAQEGWCDENTECRDGICNLELEVALQPWHRPSRAEGSPGSISAAQGTLSVSASTSLLSLQSQSCAETAGKEGSTCTQEALEFLLQIREGNGFCLLHEREIPTNLKPEM
ncbi:hypothetical protein IHE44_0015083 [Lamprotornis superbus]|uniref:RING finger protein 11 n=1 Tax=Lamprotornis superbus TaxID=245042 RepID=A0A835NQT1_9PASS|nr:hypothetical protein IHE44_0015083 [Lamprotornis superbus]